MAMVAGPAPASHVAAAAIFMAMVRRTAKAVECARIRRTQMSALANTTNGERVAPEYVAFCMASAIHVHHSMALRQSAMR